MNKKLTQIFTIIAFFFSFNMYGGENLVVEKLEELQNDLTAKIYPVKDMNDKPCALLKIWVKDKITGIQGNNIGSVQIKGLENWINLKEGTKEIKLMFENHFPIHVIFNNHGIKNLQSQKTYLLIISDPDSDNNVSLSSQNNSSKSTQSIEEFEEGLDYLYGNKKKRDVEHAKQLFFKSADHGNPDAMYYLGLMYKDGVAVEKDLKSAAKWFSKASEEFHPDAMFELANIYLDDSFDDKDPELAFVYYSYSAEAGNTAAMNTMGYYYKKGLYVDKDFSKAVELFQDAADRGSAIGQYNLALAYYKGEGVPQNLEKAFKWFEKSALLGDSYAQYNLGVMYQHGYGCDKNINKAIEYYKKASNQGHSNAALALFKLGK